MGEDWLILSTTQPLLCRPWVWQQDSAPAHKSKKDPGLASEGVLRLCTVLSLATLLPRPEPALTTSLGHVGDVLDV